jgi:hypothetical protein
MAELHEVSGMCPVCGEAMVVTRLGCPNCTSALEGTFRMSGMSGGGGTGSRSGPLGARSEEARYGRLARLDREQLEFVETFLRCRGVIKNVEDMLGISYPTVKARLASVLEAMGFGSEGELPPERRQMRRTILADLAAGRITTEEAHQLLRTQGTDDGDDRERSDGEIGED